MNAPARNISRNITRSCSKNKGGNGPIIRKEKPEEKPSEPSPLQVLIAIEGEALAAKDQLSLKHIAVNRPRALLPCGHIIWVARRGRSLSLEAISSQAQIDRTSPFIQWITGQLKSRFNKFEPEQSMNWQFEARRASDSFTYPFTYGTYAPFSPDPKAGGLLFTRGEPFTESEQAQIMRLSQIFGVASAAIGRKKRARMSVKKRSLTLGIAGLLILAAFIPVPMTTLAPAEIVADSPFMITAPIDGVVEEILIPPNSEITQGQPLVRLVDTQHRNEFLLAGQEQSVAQARLRQASLTSFIDNEAKRSLAVAQAEQKLAVARQDYAQDRLSKTTLSAPVAGLAIYSDPTDWAGKPVATGEAIIQIADPTRVLLRIDAPLAIGETLQSGARVRMFLDSDPLKAIEAELTQASYYATPTADGHMAYEAYGRLKLNPSQDPPNAASPQPRIGTRGVAKIYGDTAPLGFWLLRRPITIARQFIGF